ncbi:helix-turn-helix transcriptional regulator [Myxococcus landrumensis]|uniref:YafY family transcriptional regulator n=1 Tax=Myxococcus landrumensis TaxID=2813577 RepID=A0ABX7MWM0_9BACT|nr:YafY family protein [Myxococcus landrumus]QSQ10728.1 YafY family transcriptional regulator [Myxococcus landrumus]
MSRPTTRVLTVLELLQTHGRMSGSELARRLAVDRRTVRRYILKLEELGIPITAERGRDGAYMLVAGFKLPPMMFTDDEVLALSVGLLAARGLGLAEAAPAVASAQAKLERVMPATLKRRVRAVDASVTLDISGSRATLDNASLVALSAATQLRERVRLGYRAAREEDSQRDFDPYGLVWRGGRWYVVGLCHLRQDLRTFRLDRVRSVQPLQVHFERPDDFDALAHVTLSVATLPRAYAVEVLLDADLETARRQVFATLGVLEAVPGGGVRLLGQTDDLDWFARELARLPFAFHIQRPEEMRAVLKTRAQRLLALAGGGGGTKS